MQAQLVLSSLDQMFVPESFEDWIEALQKTEFVGEMCLPQRYRVGECFLDGVTFLGCSPELQFEPREDLRFCHFYLPAPTEQPRAWAHHHLPASKCPQCKSAIPWPGSTDPVFPADSGKCANCGHRYSLESLAWRKRQLCFSCAPVVIWDVGDGEAVPADVLMLKLQELSGSDWRFSYASHD